MAYKLKPNKSIAKRFKVSKTGKLKRHHGFTSHLMSSRSANKRRKLRKPEIVSESHARRLRKLIGLGGIGPGKTAARRAARAKEVREAAEAAGGGTATAAPARGAATPTKTASVTGRATKTSPAAREF